MWQQVQVSTSTPYKRMTMGQLEKEEKAAPQGWQPMEQWLSEVAILVYAIFGNHDFTHVSATPDETKITVINKK